MILKNSNEYPTITNLQRKYSFDSFVIGKCNEFAYDAALEAAKAPGKARHNPLFIFGGSGLGKTHLLHAIGNNASEHIPGLNVIYVTAEGFTNELIYAIVEENGLNFKAKYREADLLLIDDVQFLEGKVQTQKEMLCKIDDLYGGGKQIVMASTLSPEELVLEEPRLTSRIHMGLSAEISKPDYETAAAMLENKLRAEQLKLPKEVKEYIIANFNSNVRDMKRALNMLISYAELISCSDLIREGTFERDGRGVEEILLTLFGNYANCQRSV